MVPDNRSHNGLTVMLRWTLGIAVALTVTCLLALGYYLAVRYYIGYEPYR